MDYVWTYDSPLGEMTMASDGVALTGLWFADQQHFAAGLDPVHRQTPLPIFKTTQQWLDAYFAGRQPMTTPPLRLQGTPFRQAVWALLLQIPYGATATYGDLAARLVQANGYRAMSAQAVGGAVGHNPVSLIVPCHRIIGADGTLTGYAGGLWRKEWLLNHERPDENRRTTA